MARGDPIRRLTTLGVIDARFVDRPMVVAGMATMPSRSATFRRAVLRTGPPPAAGPNR